MTTDGTRERALNDRVSDALEVMRRGCGLSQAKLAEKMGIAQRTYSHIEAGETPLSLAAMLAAEDACGLPHGWILRRAELIADPMTVEESIRADTRLDAPWRAHALDAYEAIIRSAARLATPDDTPAT